MLDRELGQPVRLGQRATLKVIAKECPMWSKCRGNCPTQVKRQDRKCLIWKAVK